MASSIFLFLLDDMKKYYFYSLYNMSYFTSEQLKGF